MKKITSFIIFILAVIIFLWTSIAMINRFSESNDEKTILESIQSQVYKETETIKSSQNSTTLSDNSLFPKERYQRQKELFSLYEQNSDLIGWVQIDDTLVDLFVMQTTEDPDFYLKRNFNKEKNSFGSIYMDANSHIGYSKNYILYGHHMKNGSMFASINDYQFKEYFLEHPIIEFDSLTTLNDYQVIGAFKLPVSDIEIIQDSILLESEEQFKNFTNYFENHKFYDTGISYSYDDQFLTLMTCEYTNKDGRFFVFAKRINMEEQND